MDGKVVQLVQGREKALEGESPQAMLAKFAAFPQIQVIDLDAAIGKGANDARIEDIAHEIPGLSMRSAVRPSSSRSIRRTATSS